jgi:SAM-dependent methyltransferase
MSHASLGFSPAADRNKQPILEVLTRLLPDHASVLEVASGTGQHAAHCAAGCSGWRWQPTDADPEALPRIAARCAGLHNVTAPLLLDVLTAAWPTLPGPFDAVYCANLLHIAPWTACSSLMRLAACHLRPDGVLVIYGPFFVEVEPASPGNLAFDADLRSRDPQWGVRHLADVLSEARSVGLWLQQRVAMPANNLVLVLRPRA